MVQVVNMLLHVSFLGGEYLVFEIVFYYFLVLLLNILFQFNFIGFERRLDFLDLLLHLFTVLFHFFVAQFQVVFGREDEIHILINTKLLALQLVTFVQEVLDLVRRVPYARHRERMPLIQTNLLHLQIHLLLLGLRDVPLHEDKRVRPFRFLKRNMFRPVRLVRKLRHIVILNLRNLLHIVRIRAQHYFEVAHFFVVCFAAVFCVECTNSIEYVVSLDVWLLLVEIVQVTLVSLRSTLPDHFDNAVVFDLGANLDNGKLDVELLLLLSNPLDGLHIC